jgi:transposase InsO family protein
VDAIEAVPRSTQRIGPPGALSTGFRADRGSWARLRKRVFRDPPRQRNRVWQMDFSEFETARGGIWRICAVADAFAGDDPLFRPVRTRVRSPQTIGVVERFFGTL